MLSLSAVHKSRGVGSQRYSLVIPALALRAAAAAAHHDTQLDRQSLGRLRAESPLPAAPRFDMKMPPGPQCTVCGRE